LQRSAARCNTARPQVDQNIPYIQTAGATLRAQAQVDADTDHDGTITVDELGGVDAGTYRTLRNYEEQALLRALRAPGEKACPSVTVDSPLSRDGGAAP
jgi:hypothetical protein